MAYKYNFTVIIPHRNDVPSLVRCLNSIPPRDDLEVIVIDDASEKKYLEDLGNIKRNNLQIVYLNENLGAGRARNEGLKHANGQWILFADADDFYEKGLNDFLSAHLFSKVDCIYFSVTSVDSETLKPSHRNFLYDDFIKKYNPNVPGSEKWIMFKKWEPWNKMISHDFIKRHNIKFDEILKCNDMIFCMLVSYYAKSFEIIPQQLYCVTFNQKSMTFRNTKPKEFYDCLLAFKKRNIILHRIGMYRWHMFMIMQHRHFILKEGVAKYLHLLKFYIGEQKRMRQQITAFKLELQANKTPQG